MPVHLIIWLQFLICVALIGLAGTRLIRFGETIAEQMGLSRSWIGVVMVATVTSMPELVTGLSSVTIAQAPDMAAGDALGSCVFNLAILACLDIAFRRHALYSTVSHGHILTAGFGAILLATTAFALLLSQQNLLPAIGHIRWGSFVLFALYVLAMRAIYLSEKRPTTNLENRTFTRPLRSALIGYALSATVVIASGVWLPLIGVELAQVMGWSDSLVGTIFMAFATSVPELVTTLAALRIGALDLVVGNLLGSNLFDILILTLDDFAYAGGSLFASVSPMHVLTALSASIMSSAVVVALAYRPTDRVRHIGSWFSIALLALYVFNGLLQYTYMHR